LLCAGLSACGFHLRGPAELPAQLKTVRITGSAEYAPLTLELTRTLSNAGATVMPADSTGISTINIVQESYNRRVLSVDAQGRAAEYGLLYSFYFQFSNASDEVQVPKTRIEVSRDFRFDPNAVLAKDTEEKQLHAEMINFAVRQLIRRLDAVLKARH
jgi:LPS-assembly lipoprotein